MTRYKNREARCEADRSSLLAPRNGPQRDVHDERDARSGYLQISVEQQGLPIKR